MDTITLSDISNEAASRTSGLALKQQLDALLSSGAKDITVDFRGIRHFACPFFNYSFASLALIYGFRSVRAIQMRNISEVGLAAYQSSMSNAETVSQHPKQITETSGAIENDPKRIFS